MLQKKKKARALFFPFPLLSFFPSVASSGDIFPPTALRRAIPRWKTHRPARQAETLAAAEALENVAAAAAALGVCVQWTGVRVVAIERNDLGLLFRSPFSSSVFGAARDGA